MSFSTNALEIFQQVVQDLMTSDHDLRYILRRCEFACGLLNWNEPAAWFSRELSGYSAQDQLPEYRIVPARLVWVASELSAYEMMRVTVEQAVRGNPQLADEPTQMNIFAGFDNLKGGAASGFADPTEDNHR